MKGTLRTEESARARLARPRQGDHTMMTMTVQESAAARAPSYEDALAGLVDSIGHERFGPALADYLHRLCGAGDMPRAR